MAKEARKFPVEIGWLSFRGWFWDSSMGGNSGLSEAGSGSWDPPPRPPVRTESSTSLGCWDYNLLDTQRIGRPRPRPFQGGQSPAYNRGKPRPFQGGQSPAYNRGKPRPREESEGPILSEVPGPQLALRSRGFCPDCPLSVLPTDRASPAAHASDTCTRPTSLESPRSWDSPSGHFLLVSVYDLPVSSLSRGKVQVTSFLPPASGM